MARRKKKPTDPFAERAPSSLDEDTAARRLVLPLAAWETVVFLADQLKATRGIEASASEIGAIAAEAGIDYVTAIPDRDLSDPSLVARRFVFRRETLDRFAQLGARFGKGQVEAAEAALMAGLQKVGPSRSNPDPGPGLLVALREWHHGEHARERAGMRPNPAGPEQRLRKTTANGVRWWVRAFGSHAVFPTPFATKAEALERAAMNEAMVKEHHGVTDADEDRVLAELAPKVKPKRAARTVKLSSLLDQGPPGGWGPDDRVLSNPLIAVVGNPGPSRRRGRGGRRDLSTVFNLSTGELRQYPMGAGEATAAADYQDNPHGRALTGSVLGHVRTGMWCGRAGECNADPMGKMWGRVLDTVHYAMVPLSKQQARGSGVASVTRDQWVKRFARGKSPGAQDKAWSDVLRFVAQGDAQGYGLAADRRPGWLDLNISNVYDAAWTEQPGTQHQLGLERERELLGRRYEGVELAGKIADREDHYDAQEWESAEGEEEIPGGSMDAYRAMLHAARHGDVAEHEEAGSVRAGRSNPQERTGKKPKETVHDVSEFKDHPGYKEALKDFEAFHGEGAEPTKVVVYSIPDGSSKETWEPVHSFLHETVETNYTVPRDMKQSNKNQGAHLDLYPDASPNSPGLWTHKHHRGKRGRTKVEYPVEIKHPFTQTTRKVLRGTVLDDWWHS